MNTVSVKKLTVSACHGVNDFEKEQKQRFVFSVDVQTDFYDAAREDELTQTVNYSALCKRITAVATGNVFNLIETLAYRCAFDIMDNFPSVKALTLLVEKPDAPVKADFKSVSASVSLSRQTAYLSIGSSIGDKKSYLDFAVKELSLTRGITVKGVSAYMENAPYGGVAKGTFLNACVKVETYLPPHALLKEVQRIEYSGERHRGVRWDDRTLDIDIIFYGRQIICDDVLNVPHPDYINRDFVIEPLKQLAPDFVCPLYNKRIRDITAPSR
ncbi:MAG: 2-amino-4-hydroxy-6-hydroxymethyldihydropteridine diphosphokinase [Clostridia bacterium]|nr:2-amino-4-hydroxy-6-hydroxymethyldihydropteridine diphosphokinase [Clostridia bacterium]